MWAFRNMIRQFFCSNFMYQFVSFTYCPISFSQVNDGTQFIAFYAK